MSLHRHPHIQQEVAKALDQYGTGGHGARALAGTTFIHKELERRIAAFKNAEIYLLEPNNAMRSIAQRKLQKTNTYFLNTPFEEYQPSKTFDMILCVHALYLMPSSKQLIPKFRELMHNQSTLMICDIGQVINVKDWTIYLFKENLKTHGLLKTIQFWRVASEIKVANRTIEKQQRNSGLWSHTLEEFQEWFSEYYKVPTAFSCYRGCSNFLVCELP